MKQSIFSLALLAVLSLSAFGARAADVEAGKLLTEQWCTGCHVIGGGGRGTDSAPPLPVLAKNGKHDSNWVKAWLKTPHPPMPNLNLADKQIDDIAAYLDTLR